MNINKNNCYKRLTILSFLIISSIIMALNSFALTSNELEFSFDAEKGVDFDKDSNGKNLSNSAKSKSPWATINQLGADGKPISKQTQAWNKIFTQYRGVIMGVSGIATLTMVVLFIINFMKLGASAGNPQAKHQATMGLLWTGIAAAGAGGVTIFVGVASNLLK